MCRRGLERFDFEKLPCRVSFFAPTGTAPRSCRRSSALHAGRGGGFALHEAVEQRVAGVLDPHVVQFPRTGITKPPGVWPGGGGAGDGNRTRL